MTETGCDVGMREAEVRAAISLIVPAYNEERKIYEMISETHGTMKGIEPDFEIVVVDDGSADGTPAEIERAVADLDRVVAVMLPENMGKGNALYRGFQASSGDLVVFIDADLDLHPRQVTTLMGMMEHSGADIVIGSKRHKASRLDYPWYRKLFSTIYYLLILLLFRLPVKDTQTGIKLFKREVLAGAFPRILCKKYTLDLELLVVAHRLGYRIAEAPIALTFQRFGGVSWPSIRNILTDTMAVFYRLRVLRYYDSDMKPVVAREPRTSIVMAAEELGPLFERFLDKCMELNYGNFDIKVVTGGPPEGARHSPRIEYMRSDGGLSEKRNLAARLSGSELVAFLDEDSIPDTDWLRNAVPYFDDAAVAAVCGPALPPSEGTRRQKAAGLTFASFMVSGTTNYRFTQHALREVDDHPAFNFIVRRAEFLTAGGFPETLVGGEDTVLCLRLVKDLGMKLVYVPNVIVYQHRAPLFGPHLRNVYAYSTNRGAFVRKYPETSRRIPYFAPSALLLVFALGLAGSFFSSWVLLAYLGLVALYLLAALGASTKTLHPGINALIFPAIIATNMTYGFGFLRGLLAPGKALVQGGDIAPR